MHSVLPLQLPRCYVETFGPVEGRRRFRGRPTPSDLESLYRVSPISHLHKVTEPMLFLLGAKDARVPPEDAKQYINALRGRGASAAAIAAFSGLGVSASNNNNGGRDAAEGGEEGEGAMDLPPPEVRVLVFPEDTHALDKPQTEFESYVNVLAWFKKHMGK
jgi:acylaminoacyl-peptidase